MARYIIKGKRGKWFRDKGEGSTAYVAEAHPYTARELVRNWNYWGYYGRSFKPTLRQVEGS